MNAIKQLEWTAVQYGPSGISGDKGGVSAKAESVAGEWSVASFDGNKTYHVLGFIIPGDRPVFETVDAAKAYAQARYEDRIRSCLISTDKSADDEAGVIDHYSIGYREGLTDWADKVAENKRQQALIADLQEELLYTLEELRDHNGDDMIDSRATRIAELRSSSVTPEAAP